jgi:hypothetical protein
VKTYTIAVNTSRTPEEGTHSPRWQNGLIIIKIIIIIIIIIIIDELNESGMLSHQSLLLLSLLLALSIRVLRLFR